MKPKKKVLAPILSHYFRFEKNFSNLNNNLYFNTQVFNPFSFFSVIIVVCLILGCFKPFFWAIASGCLFLLVFLYHKTSKLCHGVTVVREVSAFAREKSEFVITYKITNETGFNLETLSFVEGFDGVDKGFFWVENHVRIPPQTQVKIQKKVFLNTGMGKKTFDPVKLNFRDDLGIFDFKVEFFQVQEIEVFPFVEESPAFKNSVSPDSIEYGFYELAKRGDSNLFIGTRDYRRGDPVKHINWKLTKKTNKVVVNEYEKSTNTFVTILLELNLKNQTGLGEVSTWELAKDLALSICHNEIKKNNSIQVIANNFFIPFGTGKQQISLFEKHFTFHELKDSDANDYAKHLGNLPSRGQIYFICPSLLTKDTLETIEHLKKLKDLGHYVVIFCLDPLKEMALTVQGKMKLSLLEIHRHSESEFKKLKITLERYGIPLLPISVSIEKSLHQQIVEHSRDLLEVK